MTVHTEYTLRGAGITQVLDLPLAVAATEALGAESLFTSEDCEVLDLVPTRTTAVGTVAADQRAIAKQKKVRVRVE